MSKKSSLYIEVKNGTKMFFDDNTNKKKERNKRERARLFQNA